MPKILHCKCRKCGTEFVCGDDDPRDVCSKCEQQVLLPSPVSRQPRRDDPVPTEYRDPDMVDDRTTDVKILETLKSIERMISTFHSVFVWQLILGGIAALLILAASVMKK